MSEKSYNLNGVDMDEAGVTDMPKGAKDVGTDSAQVNMSSKSSQVDNKGLSLGTGTLASAKNLHPGDIIIKVHINGFFSTIFLQHNQYNLSYFLLIFYTG